MKKVFIGAFVIIATMILSPTASQAQFVVKVKPNRPKIVLVKPQNHRSNHIWAEGHWKWNKRKHKYMWKKGHWVKRKKHHIWVKGHWKKVPKGWIWVEGHWTRR